MRKVCVSVRDLNYYKQGLLVLAGDGATWATGARREKRNVEIKNKTSPCPNMHKLSSVYVTAPSGPVGVPGTSDLRTEIHGALQHNRGRDRQLIRLWGHCETVYCMQRNVGIGREVGHSEISAISGAVSDYSLACILLDILID